jgi:hypothetical protein
VTLRSITLGWLGQSSQGKGQPAPESLFLGWRWKGRSVWALGTTLLSSPFLPPISSGICVLSEAGLGLSDRATKATFL